MIIVKGSIARMRFKKTPAMRQLFAISIGGLLCGVNVSCVQFRERPPGRKQIGKLKDCKKK